MGHSVIVDGIPFGSSAPPYNNMGQQVISEKVIERNKFLRLTKQLVDKLTVDKKKD